MDLYSALTLSLSPFSDLHNFIFHFLPLKGLCYPLELHTSLHFYLALFFPFSLSPSSLYVLLLFFTPSISPVFNPSTKLLINALAILSHLNLRPPMILLTPFLHPHAAFPFFPIIYLPLLAPPPRTSLSLVHRLSPLLRNIIALGHRRLARCCVNNGPAEYYADKQSSMLLFESLTINQPLGTLL